MKRTVAALAAGLLPCFVPTSAEAVEHASLLAIEPAPAEATEAPAPEAEAAPEGEAAPADTAAPTPSAPTAPEPPKAEAGAEGSVKVGKGKPKTRLRTRKEEKEAEPDPNDPKVYEMMKAKERPWIRRWEPKRNLFELGIFGGLLRPSDEHDLYDPITRPQDPLWTLGADVGARAAFFPLKALGVEAEFSANPTRVRTVTNDFAFVYGFRGHVILQVPRYRITPFLLGGYGLMGVRSNILVLGNDIDPAFHYGGGVKMYITKRLAARVEVRQIVSASATLQDSGTSHFQALGGLSLVLGRKRPVPPPVVVPEDPDRDKDGILNVDDQCPDQPGPGPSGCPDTDGDGFIDKVDACIEVPGVKPDGCPPKDTDGDMILDLEDDCVFEKEIYNGVDDDDGCPDDLPPELLIFKGELEGIEFEFGKATIRPDSTPVLDDVAAKLKKFPGLRVLIVGHTDNVGDAETNLQLSKRRAEAVKQYLVDKEVDASRIETDGKGDTDPVATNDTEEGRAKNRRIVFDIIANEPTEVRPLHGEDGELDPDAELVEPKKDEPAAEPSGEEG